ncbi:hypothetical protein B4064_1096 [Caldibacillus thermoamylovorans]|nr:hypothetical protein B4064_1096 [Caldibacillus thermoamylovorans]
MKPRTDEENQLSIPFFNRHPFHYNGKILFMVAGKFNKT